MACSGLAGAHAHTGSVPAPCSLSAVSPALPCSRRQPIWPLCAGWCTRLSCTTRPTSSGWRALRRPSATPAQDSTSTSLMRAASSSSAGCRPAPCCLPGSTPTTTGSAIGAAPARLWAALAACLQRCAQVCTLALHLPMQLHSPHAASVELPPDTALPAVLQVRRRQVLRRAAGARALSGRHAHLGLPVAAAHGGRCVAAGANRDHAAGLLSEAHLPRCAWPHPGSISVACALPCAACRPVRRSARATAWGTRTRALPRCWLTVVNCCLPEPQAPGRTSGPPGPRWPTRPRPAWPS